MNDFREKLKKAETIVIKVGTSTITYETGKLNFNILKRLVFEISDLKNQGKKVILVTSGAIAVGVEKLGLSERPKEINKKQAAAAIGQCELMHIYSKLFAEYGYVVGQILLTREEIDFEERKRNVINTFTTLLNYDAIPVVNENDSIAVEEIEFGDNDTLSAVVAKLVNADLLIILTDTDGLYTSDPNINFSAKLISVVEKIDESIERYASETQSKRGTGGMITKIIAAKIATQAGIDVVVTNGQDPGVIREILEGKNIGTLFVRQRNDKCELEWR